MSEAFTEDFERFIEPGQPGWRYDPGAQAGFEAGWRACEQRLTPQIHRALEEPTQNEDTLSTAWIRLRQAVLDYDAAIQRVAERGEHWVSDIPELDELYVAMLTATGEER